MYSVSEVEKEAYKVTGTVKRGYIDILPLNSDEQSIRLDEYSIKSFTILDEIYLKGNGFIGTAISKQLSIELFKPLSIDLTNRELDVYIGVDVLEEDNYVTKYLPSGRYMVQKPENEVLTERTTFEALDYMIKFNEPYVDNLEYPCKVKDILSYICEQCGVDLGTLEFPNMDFEVENNQFVAGESYRDVLKGIAHLSCSFAKIDRDNKLYLYFPQSFVDNENIEKIDKKIYYRDIKVNNTFGPVNRVVLRMSQVEGENVTREDEESIETDGLHELVLYDNPFTYTQEKREQVIDTIWSIVKGFKYVDFETKYVPLPYHDTGDAIEIEYEKTDETTGEISTEEIYTYIFRQEINFTGGLSGEISATAETETETKYAFIPQLSSRVSHTEILVDKANEQITAIIEVQEDHTKQITRQQLEIGNITNSVQMIGGNNKQQNSVGAFGTDYEGSGELIADKDHNLTEGKGGIYYGNVEVVGGKRVIINGGNKYLRVSILELDENGEQVYPDDIPYSGKTYEFYDQDPQYFTLNSRTHSIDIQVGATENFDSLLPLLNNFYISYADMHLVALETQELKETTESGRALQISDNAWFKLRSDDLVIGNTYTLSFLYTATQYSKCEITFINNTTETLVKLEELESQDEWKKVEYTFVANTANVETIIRTYDGTVTVSDYYIQTGDVATPWQPGQGEIRGTNVQINRNGLNVRNESSETRTAIDSLGFSVKSEATDETIITANKDEAILAKTRINGSLTQSHWKTYTQEINRTEYKLEVYE